MTFTAWTYVRIQLRLAYMRGAQQYRLEWAEAAAAEQAARLCDFIADCFEHDRLHDAA